MADLYSNQPFCSNGLILARIICSQCLGKKTECSQSCQSAHTQHAAAWLSNFKISIPLKKRTFQVQFPPLGFHLPSFLLLGFKIVSLPVISKHQDEKQISRLSKNLDICFSSWCLEITGKEVTFSSQISVNPELQVVYFISKNCIP